MLAQCMHCFYDEDMPNITIRNVDPVIHDALKDKADASGKSLQEFLASSLADLATRKSNAEIIRAHREQMARNPGEWATRDQVLTALGDSKKEQDARWHRS